MARFRLASNNGDLSRNRSVLVTTSTQVTIKPPHERSGRNAHATRPITTHVAAQAPSLGLPFNNSDSSELDDPRRDGATSLGSAAMGVIRKKTATRGGEGGVKYVCDICSADITSTVSCFYADTHDSSVSNSLIPGSDPVRSQRLQRI